MNKEKKTPLTVYKDYVALKAHFSSNDYDYFKHNGRTTASLTSYEKRNDKGFFKKLADHKDSFNYILCNIAYNDYWVGDIILNELAEKNYKTFRTRKEGLSYHIRQDLKHFKNDLKSNFTINDTHPYILQLYIEGAISLETISVLSAVTGASDHWNKYLGNDIIWQTYRNKVNKFHQFLTYDKARIQNLMLDR